MNNTLLNNLKYINNDLELSFDVDLAHVYLKEYKKTNDEKILKYIERIQTMTLKDNYLKYPFLIGHDTIINKMHNYHKLIPEVLNLNINTIEDLYMLYEILTFINTMMYDEYDQIRKKYQACLIQFSKINKSSLLDLLIKLSVSQKFVNVSLLDNLSNLNSDDLLINALHMKIDKILESQGKFDLYML